MDAVESPPSPSIFETQSYPKDFESNADYRLRVLLKSVNNRDLQVVMKSICADDILYWINVFTSTYNPRKNPSVIPFVTYPFQDELILDLVDRVKNQKDLLVDKSRDMGVTWCVLLVMTWFWQFGPEGSDFMLGSRKEQYIDVVGNMDTLIEKVRFLIRNQPKWMVPKGFDWKRDSNYMRIINPVTKSTITGEATNENFSRGGRRRAIFFDEFAFWEVDSAAWRASADSTNCRIVVSTPNGMNNQFAKLRFSNSIDVKSLHWKLHPEKDEAWYANECKRRNFDAVEIARELDIDYEGSEEGLLFKWEDMRQATKNEPILSQDRKVVSLDPAGEGDDEAVFYVFNNGAVIERQFFKKSTGMELASVAVGLLRKHKAQVFITDAIGNDVLSVVVNLLGRNEDKIKCIGIKNSEKAQDPVKFYNKRAEVYHYAANMLKSGNVQLDDDYILMSQLNATHYKTKDGRIIVIPKEEIRELLGKSPDRADAWALGVWGLQFTHSRREVEQAEKYRKILLAEEVESGHEYGDWGDNL